MLGEIGLLGIVQLAGVIAGVVIAGYLAAIRLAGGLPVCVPGGGCETVALSDYSTLFGVPVAVLGLAFSIALATAVVGWIVTESRRPLYAAYALSLFGVVFVAYLTYLELFVIHAVCAWCVAYAISVVVTFVATAAAARREQT